MNNNCDNKLLFCHVYPNATMFNLFQGQRLIEVYKVRLQTGEAGTQGIQVS